MTHQAALTDRFLAQRWRHAGHPRYVDSGAAGRVHAVLGPQHRRRHEGPRVRALGLRDGLAHLRLGLVDDGNLAVRHEAYDGRKLGVLRFADRYTDSFRNEAFGGSNKDRTAPQCHERYVDRGGLPLRAVLCMSAYKKLTGLYDVSVLVATVDAAQSGVQGRFDANGVELRQRAQAGRVLPGGFGWTRGETTGRR